MTHIFSASSLGLASGASECCSVPLDLDQTYRGEADDLPTLHKRSSKNERNRQTTLLRESASSRLRSVRLSGFRNITACFWGERDVCTCHMLQRS